MVITIKYYKNILNDNSFYTLKPINTSVFGVLNFKFQFKKIFLNYRKDNMEVLLGAFHLIEIWCEL
jgi:hypothetical protein